MIETILSIINKVLDLIPQLKKWFSKPLAEKQQATDEAGRAESAAMKDTGRPTWKK